MSYTSYKCSKELWQKGMRPEYDIFAKIKVVSFSGATNKINATQENVESYADFPVETQRNYPCYTLGQLVREIEKDAEWIMIEFDGGQYNVSACSLTIDNEEGQAEISADTPEDAAGMLLIKLLK